jgi:predicted Fe-Mo cluster-binding NifX family protein
MIAIPVDSKGENVKSSKLFGNVEMFALYEPKDDKFTFMKNSEAGNGIKTSKLLKEWDVSSVVYSHMGDGPFKTLNGDGIDIYYIGKEPMELNTIVSKMKENSFVKVDTSNSDTYLDPGTGSGKCECGCTHE